MHVEDTYAQQLGDLQWEDCPGHRLHIPTLLGRKLTWDRAVKWRRDELDAGRSGHSRGFQPSSQVAAVISNVVLQWIKLFNGEDDVLLPIYKDGQPYQSQTAHDNIVVEENPATREVMLEMMARERKETQEVEDQLDSLSASEKMVLSGLMGKQARDCGEDNGGNKCHHDNGASSTTHRLLPRHRYPSAYSNLLSPPAHNLNRSNVSRRSLSPLLPHQSHIITDANLIAIGAPFQT